MVQAAIACDGVVQAAIAVCYSSIVCPCVASRSGSVSRLLEERSSRRTSTDICRWSGQKLVRVSVALMGVDTALVGVHVALYYRVNSTGGGT